MKEFYQQTVKEVLDRVESRETGLTSEQAGKSRERCGWNELAEIEEMLRTCDRMVVMRDGAKVGELSGNEMNQSSIMSTIAGGQ